MNEILVALVCGFAFGALFAYVHSFLWHNWIASVWKSTKGSCDAIIKSKDSIISEQNKHINVLRQALNNATKMLEMYRGLLSRLEKHLDQKEK
jgi:hypothetical protein